MAKRMESTIDPVRFGLRRVSMKGARRISASMVVGSIEQKYERYE